MDCFLREVPLCLDGDHLEEAENIVEHALFDSLFNETKTLGRRLMDECSFVQAKQSGLMMRLAGSDRCSFYDHESRRIAMEECLGRTNEVLKQQLDNIRFAPDPE